jgi:hypothetical protein
MYIQIQDSRNTMNERLALERSLQEIYNLPDTDSNFFSHLINEDLNA